MRRSVNLQDVNSTLQCSPLSVSLGLHVNLRVTSALRTGYVYTTAVAADTMTALVVSSSCVWTGLAGVAACREGVYKLLFAFLLLTN